MTSIPLLFPPKAPADVLDYTMDFSPLAPQDTITGATATSSPNDLTLSTPTWNKGLVTVWIGGGTQSTSYWVDISITTQQGRDETRSAILNVQPRV